MSFSAGKYLVRVALHAEAMLYSILDELETLKTDHLFLNALDRLAAVISLGTIPNGCKALGSPAGFWTITLQGVRMNFSVDQVGKWIIIEHFP